MERNKKSPFLFLLLSLLQVCVTRSEGCPSLPDKNLTCYNDFSHNITCFWNSTTASDHMDSVCTIHAQKVPMKKSARGYSANCTLQPVDPSNPAIRKCSLIFKRTFIFLDFHELSINLSCIPLEKSQIISYRPACHVKVNPPAKPYVNSTIVSWVSTHRRILDYNLQLQWKQKDHSWSDPSFQKYIKCKESCEAQLNLHLMKGELYEARVRVQSILKLGHGTWSDWSPSESWMSSVGETKPPGVGVDIMKMSLVGLGVFGLFLVVIFCKTDKTMWVYKAKMITSPPLPNPAKSFLFQTWLTPHFTSESFHSYFKPMEIASVEITTTVDALTPCEPGVKKMTDEESYECSSSSFSNPSYSEFCSPPVSSLTAGNLEPCAADSSYGPICGQGEGKNKGHDSDVVAEKNIEILQLFSKCSHSRKSLQMISDYQKFQKVKLKCLRLQSVDSGMCSCEEVSQESMEVDSIHVTDGGTQDKDEKEGGDGKNLSFQRLFGSSEGDFGKECIEVSFNYNLIPKLQADSPELPSLESGINSGGEEHESQEESMEDEDKSTESTRFLFPPHPSTVLPCSPLSFNFSGLDLSPALKPLPSPGMFERLALMSESRFMEPSDDGYMPVRKEQSEEQTVGLKAL